MSMHRSVIDNPTLPEIRERLQQYIEGIHEDRMNVIDWSWQQGVLLSGNEAELIIEVLDKHNKQYLLDESQLRECKRSDLISGNFVYRQDSKGVWLKYLLLNGVNHTIDDLKDCGDCEGAFSVLYDKLILLTDTYVKK